MVRMKGLGKLKKKKKKLNSMTSSGLGSATIWLVACDYDEMKSYCCVCIICMMAFYLLKKVTCITPTECV
jgi:hypothetical protein